MKAFLALFEPAALSLKAKKLRAKETEHNICH